MDKGVFEKMFNISQEFAVIGRLSAWYAQTAAKLYYLAYVTGFVLLFIAHDEKIIIYIIFPLLTLITSHTFRQAIKRARPYEEYPIKPFITTKKKVFSMPSNHSASSMIIALAFLYISPLIGFVLIAGSVLVGICRILAGIHYPFDVCVGWLLALINGSVMLYILL